MSYSVTQHIKDMAPADLALLINKMNQPNKWALTRRAAQGMHRQNKVGGNSYPPGYMSDNMRKKKLRQIEKGMIQITKEKVNEGNSKIL